MTGAGDFQPLFPEERVLGPLLERAGSLVTECLRLSAHAGQSLGVALSLRLRAMNSYEGQHTRPADIERALTRAFDADAQQARKQRLALAHMEAEAELEGRVPGMSLEALYDPGFIGQIHAGLYQRLPEADRVTEDAEIVVPGAWRMQEVTAGRHLAPPAEDVEALVAAWGARYRALPGTELAVVGVACAHHRLLWIHPFVDGNGRTARLHSHLMFHALRLSGGVWSPMRGLARTREAYYARLSNADLPRRNDQDGRGPLSQEELVAFAAYFLDVCLDQVTFMRGMLDLGGLRARIADLLGYLAAHPWSVGSERSVVKLDALEAVHYTAIAGPVERARFMAMTGLPERTARRVLASLLDFGLLTSTSSRAPVGFAVPLASLRFLFPRLWPEAEVEG
ncbi:MAG: Fic family protein [Gammaproteobacteria bacterium]|nr:Fic family protein [Gammaproteobacteria bacterium]